MSEEKQRILKKRNKTNSNEKKQVQVLRNVIHDHTLHNTLHQIYIFLFETGMQSEKVRAPDKSLERPSGRKRGVSPIK